MANPKRPPSREVRRLRKELRRLMERWDAVIRRGAELERDLAQGLAQLRESRAAETLREIPVTQAEHPDGAIRTAALEKAGIHTMAEVLGYSRKELVEISGFGETSAERILDAADRMLEAARQSVRLHLGQDAPATLPVLRTVYRALRERPMAAQAAEQAEELRSRAKVLEQESLPASGFFRWLFASRPQRERAAAAVEDIRALLESETARQLARWEQESAQADAAGESEILREFEEQAAAYYTAVEDITGASLPDTAAHGALSDELIQAVESFPLDTSRLRVTLRRYQTFGAKYALCQKRTLIGDEMGLGKTIEAIAVMAHLAARDSGKFLIVCPAGVLINWCREIEKHSSVPVLRLYGDDREELCTRWLSEGGAGVTTYETLQRLPLEGLEHLDLLIADEAHYVKNPEARRTAALTALAQKAERVLYLTGTPLENRVEEMCFLLSTLSPETAAKARELSDMAGAEPFRQAIAPVYLRRRREDVLTELPELTEVEDWCEQTPAEAEVYRQYRYRQGPASAGALRGRRRGRTPGADLHLLPGYHGPGAPSARRPLSRRDPWRCFPGGTPADSGRVRPQPCGNGSVLSGDCRRCGAQYPGRQSGDLLRTPAQALHRGPGHLPCLPHGTDPVGAGAPAAHRGHSGRGHHRTAAAETGAL